MNSIIDEARTLEKAGRGIQAIAALRGALEGAADHIEVWEYLADLQMRLGSFAEAAESFQHLIKLRPEDVTARNRLAIAMARDGKLQDAVALLRSLTAECPDDAAGHHNLGVALTERRDYAEAVSSFARAIELCPGYREAHQQLAHALRSLGKLREAEVGYRRAMALVPDDPGVLHDLGTLLTELRRPGEAEVFLRQACRLRPDWIDAHNNLGLALLADGQFDAARESFEQTIRLDPRWAPAHTNLATVYENSGRLPQALAAYDTALALDPTGPSIHWNRALALLKSGDYERGWAEYEWRWRRGASPPRSLPKPVWDGSDLHGRTILLYGEQGLGDTIQFARYAALMKHRGAARVVLECGWPISAVLRTCPGVDELVVEGSPLPEFDVHLPLLSAPSRFRTTLATIPNDIPYLFAEPERVAYWGQVVNEAGPGGLNVGIYWQGNPHFQLDRFRRVPLELFKPLADVPGVRLFSLQRGPGAEQLDRWAAALAVREIMGRDVGSPSDWADTAAVMKNLDLVVTSCTASAHLAGALGVPTWVLVSSISDWRWMLDRSDSPWYPMARLYRQERLGEWRPVMRRVAEDLEQLRLTRGGRRNGDGEKNRGCE